MDLCINYFAIGNSDCPLITLSDNSQIILDCDQL
jgi:hypothetical protein